MPDIRELATAALDDIQGRDPQDVVASGRGKVMASAKPAYHYHAFRAVMHGGKRRIRFEIWNKTDSNADSVSTHWLPPDLEARAFNLLETMPQIGPICS